MCCTSTIATLRAQRGQPVEQEDFDMSEEPKAVATIRMPKCLYDALKHEARERHTSLNELCIAKLSKESDKADVQLAAQFAGEVS